MSWTSTKTFVAGAVLTASDMNTYVSANDDALRTGAIALASQAAGDVLYASGASQLARLAITANAVLRANAGGTAPEWTLILDEDAMGSDSATDLATQQSIKAYASAAGNLSSGTVAKARLPTVLDAIEIQSAGGAPLISYRQSAGAGDTIISGTSDNVSTDTQHFRVLGDGDCENTNNSYGAISDERLKQDIEDHEPVMSALSRVKVRRFRFIDGGDDGPLRRGVIAQEMLGVYPDMVREPDKDGMMGVRYSQLVPVLVKAAQELQEQIDELRGDK